MGPDELDADKILAEVEKPGDERAMSAEPPQGEPPAAEPPAWNGEEWAFEVNGRKIIPESRDHISKWMSQGFNYSQRVGELNKKEQTWQQQLAERDAKLKGYSKYDEINAYAAQNPEWWKHVEAQWNSRQTPQVDPALAHVIQPLQEKLGKFESFFEQMQAEKEQQALQVEDKKLETEVSEIRKQYPNIDLSSTDETGKPLELAVLEHAKQLGTTSFRAAFRDYFHDKLVTKSAADAKEAEAKQRVAETRRGIIAKTATPTKQPDITPYRKGQSWDDVHRDVLDWARANG